MKNTSKCFEKSLLNLKQKETSIVECCQSRIQEPEQ